MGRVLAQRDSSRDIARGFAIIAVVLGHVLGGLVDAGARDVPDAVAGLTRALYLTHLPVFAFVTGLLMPASIDRRGARRYLAERISTIAYLYLLWTFIQRSRGSRHVDVKNYPTTWGDVLSVWTPRAHLWLLPTLAVATTWCHDAHHR